MGSVRQNTGTGNREQRRIGVVREVELAGWRHWRSRSEAHRRQWRLQQQRGESVARGSTGVRSQRRHSLSAECGRKRRPVAGRGARGGGAGSRSVEAGTDEAATKQHGRSGRHRTAGQRCKAERRARSERSLLAGQRCRPGFVRISRRRMTDGKTQGVEASRCHGIGRRCSRDSAEAAVPGRGKGRADCPQAL